MNFKDPLTYRYPRTTVQAFGCDATSAQAIYRYKRPLSMMAAGFITRLTVAGSIAIGLLAYFDILK